jgi:hypothetical protein
MKARLFVFVLTIFTLTSALAQMRVQQDGNTVTFIVDDNIDGDDWDANGNPIYLYLYIDSSGASNSMSSEPLGAWPGTEMFDLGGNIYKRTIDLSDFYPEGTTVFEIQFTYNDNMGNQNPTTGGFNATDFSYIPITITTLSTLDFEENKTEFNIINGQLVVSKNETVSVNVYNITGQRVKTFANINLDSNNGLDLNLNKNQLYLVRIESQNGIKVIKTVN